ncbi:MAG TPA: hypothetical protein VFW71_08000 [Actinomycetota bacterium]|nr:hypothetical protein [Actinomycetota bacterium]
MSVAAERVISLLAELTRLLSDFAAELGRESSVRSSTAAVTPRTYGTRDRVECYVDAELASGHAVGCWLEFRFEDGSWIVESSIRVNGDEGEDELLGLPTRYAVDDEELVAEVRGAAVALIGAVRQLDFSEL